MALPRFLYSTSESVHEELITRSGSEESPSTTPRSKKDFLGALSTSKKELARNPALRPSFTGYLDTSDSEKEEDTQQERVENRREWELGGAAVTMELSEPGKAGESDSDESGILERMGEPRPERDAKKNGAVAEPEGCANKGFGINEDVDSSASTLKRGSQLNRVSAISSKLSGKVVDSGFSCCEALHG